MMDELLWARLFVLQQVIKRDVSTIIAHKKGIAGIVLKKKRGDHAMFGGIALAALLIVIIVVASSERVEAIMEDLH
jgi:hypothetical protein